MLSILFTNLREHTIATKGVDFTEDLVPFDSIGELRSSENQRFLSSFQELLNFGDTADFARTAKTKVGVQVQQKNRTITCNPGKTYPCGASCKSQDKPCKSPIAGQAKTYAEFISLQSKQPKKSVQKSIDKKDKTQDTGKSRAKKKQEETKMITKTDVPNTEIERLDRGTRIVPVKKITGVDSSSYDSTELDNLAQSILQNKTQSPVIVQRYGRDFKIIAGEKMAAALQRAREIDPQSGEKANVFIAEDDDQASAYKYQMQFLKEPTGEQLVSKAEKRVMDNVGVTTELGQEQTVTINRITGGSENYDSDTVEKLAQSQLKIGSILPIVVKRESLTSFKLEAGGLAFAAAKRAREIDPKSAEQVRVFIADDDNELEVLKYQVGK
jgi:hypothetical protein